ncbi:MAG: tRNA (N(6)-L-threonylcarbamoyladenosine(37)-C(2))-methylthiotransferase MtaB [Chloroflexota bacterium]
MKVYLDTVGCRLNQSEIERMARQFRAAGHEIAAVPEGADLAVVNTCAVTGEAASDSRQRIRHIARLGADEVVVTGCWATLQPEQAAALPGVKRVVRNDKKDALVADLLDLPVARFDLEPLAREPLPGLHRRTRAFIKVQDGCDNACTFCVTTAARGASRSRPAAEVLADIRAALAGGAKEIVLTGVHLGSWGQDFGCHLRDLIRAILDETDTPRLRLSSLEPWDLDADFFSLWRDPRLCRHLHLPLQSGSRSVLRRMARRTTPESFRGLVAAARAVVPEAAITTDVIAGFPGETDEEFAETLAFVREMDFAGGHVFTYSSRPGTSAARMKNHVPMEARKRRNAALREAFDLSAQRYRARFLGHTLSVLWETALENGPQGWRMSGLTDTYLRVAAHMAQPLWNEVSQVRLDAMTADGVIGAVVG